MAEIVIIGASIVDVLARPVSEKALRAGTTAMEDIFMTTGADALNEALLLAKMGKKVRLETVIGDDAGGKLILECCREHGIEIRKSQIRSDVPTGINIVLVSADGERSFLTNPRGSLRRITLEDVRMPFEDDAKILSFASMFVFPEIGVKELAKIFSQAKSQGMTVCADMTKCKNGETVEDMKEALAYIDYIFPNEAEACLLTGEDNAEAAAESLVRAGVKHAVVKIGARGCLVRTAEESFVVPPEREVVCIDTTGAGDSFAAGFICALADGKSLRGCARFANECGGRAAGTFGATEWLQ